MYVITISQGRYQYCDFLRKSVIENTTLTQLVPKIYLFNYNFYVSTLPPQIYIIKLIFSIKVINHLPARKQREKLKKLVIFYCIKIRKKTVCKKIKITFFLIILKKDKTNIC